jgi:hypothetical protein
VRFPASRGFLAGLNVPRLPAVLYLLAGSSGQLEPLVRRFRKIYFMRTILLVELESPAFNR